MRKIILFLVIVLFLVLIWFIVNSSKVSLISPTAIITPIPQILFAKVTRVIDGDTIVINSGAHIRYIGMNTPELETSECFATEAAEINSNLVLGKEVKLVRDVSDTDKYGRLLRYVYVGDTFVDDQLVKAGAAKVETVPPDIEYKDQFKKSEESAKENKLGMWGKCLN